jgi:hypothetical protein
MSEIIISIGATVVIKNYNMLTIDIDRHSNDKIIKKCKEFYDKFKFNLRLYKTKNGHRAFVTNKKFNIKSDFAIIKTYFEFLEADIRYLTVACNNGELDYFHARIVPKQENFKTFDEKQIIENFIQYQKNKDIAVCRYLDSIGDGYILEDFVESIKKHDYATKAFNKNSILV